MKPSANILIDATREVYVEVVDAYVPEVTPDENCWKKANEVGVMVIDPWLDQTVRASYSCSATAKVDRYQGYRYHLAPHDQNGTKAMAYISSLIRIFRVPADIDGGVTGNTTVDAIDGPERIDIDFQIG